MPVVSFEPLAPVMNSTFCCCATLAIAMTSELATPPVTMIALFCVMNSVACCTAVLGLVSVSATL